MLRRTMAVLVVAAIGGCCGTRSATEPVSATPYDTDAPLRLNGRVAPLLPEGVRTAPYDERLKAIEEAARVRAEAMAKFPPPSLVAPRVRDGSIRVDGKLDDKAWADAPVAVIARDTNTGKPAATEARVRVVWDSKGVYFAFDLDDKEVAATLTTHDGDLWREDVAEFFLDANGDEASYIEVELNPLGAVYDASIADYRPESDWTIKRMNFDIDRSKAAYRARGMKFGIQIDGKLNDAAAEDRGWTCEIMLPWEDIARGTNTGHLPPRDGDVWRVGLYRNDVNPTAKTESYDAWNPTLTWFHRPWSFGRLIFVER